MPPVQPSPLWSPDGPSRQQRAVGWVAIAALAIAFVASGVAIGSWFRPIPESRSAVPPPSLTYTDGQIASARENVCNAYRQVRRALDIAGARNSGSDPTTTLAVATASRQALDVGSQYLLNKLGEEPATSPDLAAAVRKLSGLYQQITISYLADVADSDIGPLRQAAEQPSDAINQYCK